MQCVMLPNYFHQNSTRDFQTWRHVVCFVVISLHQTARPNGESSSYSISTARRRHHVCASVLISIYRYLNTLLHCCSAIYYKWMNIIQSVNVYPSITCTKSNKFFCIRGDRGRLAPGASWHPPCFIMFQVSESAL